MQRAQDADEFDNNPEWILNELDKQMESCNTTIYSLLSTADYGTFISSIDPTCRLPEMRGRSGKTAISWEHLSDDFGPTTKRLISDISNFNHEFERFESIRMEKMSRKEHEKRTAQHGIDPSG
jgi:hypothetical protein